jgi:formylglycine-generating enzyme required for sulfatase activity
MAGKIFVNYRRGDDPGFTQALYLRLEDEFSAADLFMDVEGHIKPGDDFVEVLNAQVAAADVLLVVIGPRWADLLAARTGDPDDFVAIEIKAALDQGKRIIPVLVNGASMPRADILPETIRAFARRNAVGLRPERFKADCQGLVAALKESLAAAVKEKAARTEADRAEAEAERRRREAEEAARLAAAEEAARLKAVAGLSPEEIRKAEELANWDFIKERGSLQALRDHMARFPGGVTAVYALTRLEELTWAGLGAAPDIVALRAYLDEFPKGEHAGLARERFAKIEKEASDARAAAERKAKETAAWAKASGADTAAAYQAYLEEWPGGEHFSMARARLKELTRSPFRRRVLIGIGVAGAALGLVGVWQATKKTTIVQIVPAFAEPEMVTIPAGEFMMGSNEYDDEKPPHKVKIAKPFLVGKFAVTFDEWDICVHEGGCTHNPSDLGWGRVRRPVINVSWNDAKEYTAWLAKKTGKPYRLLTEAQWEYAARAGTTTKYYWGDDIGRGNANCDGCGSQWDNKQTAPVGSFKQNPFGLYDMAGNVWQWVEDCKGDYKDAPTDGSANATKGCSSRVLRGGSWNSNPQYLRAAHRDIYYVPVIRYNVIGFRVARTLNP